VSKTGLEVVKTQPQQHNSVIPLNPLSLQVSDKQFSDKKNVLRKIGAIVKKIIFSCGGWVSRHSILTEIYRLDREHQEFSDSSNGTVNLFNQLLNLKRRVYDSLSVLSSAGVIISKRQPVEYSTRREIFYSACIPSGKFQFH